MSQRYDRLKMVRVMRLSDHFVVEIQYKDDKVASYSVDRGNLDDKRLLEEAFRSVFLQIENKGKVLSK